MTLLECAGVSSSNFDQSIELGKAKLKPIGSFAMSPDALAALLNEKMALTGAAGTYRVDLFCNSADCLLHLLRGAGAGWPSATLFFGHHWGVVDGYETDATGKNVTAVWFHSPIQNPAGTKDGVPPHSKLDTCGSGGSLGPTDVACLLSEFSTTYLKPCGALAKYYEGASFVSVDRATPPPTPLLLSGVDPLPLPTNGDEVELAKLASLMFQGYRNELAVTQEGETLSVLSLDDQYSNYRLVALVGEDGREFWLKLREGTRRPVAVACEGSPQAPSVSVEQAAEIAAALRPGVLVSEVSEHFVWRPCPESFSPFLPFREVSMGNGDRVYVRVDGLGFSSLSDLTPGA